MHPPEGPAQLDRLEFALVRDAAANVVDEGPERRAHGDFHQPDVIDVAGDGKHLGALAFFGTDAGIPRPAVED